MPLLLTAFASSMLSQVQPDFIRCFWETGKKATVGVVVQKLPMNK